MDKNTVELLRMGAVGSAMELCFKFTLDKLAQQPGINAKATIDEIESELVAAARNATPTPNLPNEVYLSLVESGVRASGERRRG
ncbi:hypothetical protein [Bosea minatitlanensis]|uniref:Ketopantoate reductase C-terminal domain-containing protein n=1 Tax=Bosea minatitlanensis TaxID=128782 RepID=A0ABW0F314_9HYPH|nr:hypothetical protein [Bosea minatitlanensis]MCT4493000.1 hypothetical protein [Bosea minatitlanensis]